MTDDEKVTAKQREHAARTTGAFASKEQTVLKPDPHAKAVARPMAPAVAVAEAAPAPRGATTLLGQMVDALKLTPENVRGLIVQECRELEALLLEKNAGYGNSALDPVRLFSKASPIEQLKVRIDDKLSRVSRGDFTKVREEDLKVVTKDLLGYLILIRVGWRLGLE